MAGLFQIYKTDDPLGPELLKKIKLGLCYLNEHRFRHSFEDCLDLSFYSIKGKLLLSWIYYNFTCSITKTCLFLVLSFLDSELVFTKSFFYSNVLLLTFRI